MRTNNDEMFKGSVCLFCNKGILQEKVLLKEIFDCLDRTFELDNVVSFDCNECGEGYYSYETSKRMDEAIIKVRNQVIAEGKESLIHPVILDMIKKKENI